MENLLARCAMLKCYFGHKILNVSVEFFGIHVPGIAYMCTVFRFFLFKLNLFHSLSFCSL